MAKNGNFHDCGKYGIIRLAAGKQPPGRSERPMLRATTISPHRQQIYHFRYGGQHKGTHYRPLRYSPLYAGREAASRPYKGLRQQQSNRPPRYFADSGVCKDGLFFPYRQRNKTYDPCMREAALRRSRAL